MSTSPNFWLVTDRLSQADLPASVKVLVESALLGDTELASALKGGPLPQTGPRPEPPPPLPPSWLMGVEVQGFRGIGQTTRLDLTPGPGLTLVVGRNGCGKSSLAEALEYVLTGDTKRWADRSPKSEWVSGWRNLHAAESPQIVARLAVEGMDDPLELTVEWAREAELDDATRSARAGRRVLDDDDPVGWADATAECRPFLSYNELSRALDRGPSKLFDALHGLLGVSEITDAAQRLGAERRARAKAYKAARTRAEALCGELETSTEPQAASARDALLAFDLIALERLTDAEPPADDPFLRAAASLNVLVPADVDEAADRLRSCADARIASSRTDVETAGFLEEILGWETRDCPICEAPLADSWPHRARDRIQALRARSAGAIAAETALDAAVSDARRLLHQVPPPPPTALPAAQRAREAYEAWIAAPTGPAALADHLIRRAPPLIEAYSQLRDLAHDVAETRAQSWAPLRRQLAHWLEDARVAAAGNERVHDLQAAETWLKEQEHQIRQERFAPIADRARQTWSLLRQKSNVDLQSVALAGSATRRRVELQVSIDGEPGVALGVMSQGELNALALSLFLPRLTREDSPFRFLVIDDPVQAMDPARVDGLARVLERAAETHQVVVFTHDARLPIAANRLRVPYRLLRVSRQTGSQVQIREEVGPVEQYLADARQIVREVDKLGVEAVRRIVPGLCRDAVEAACDERIWHDQLEKGLSHTQIETSLRETRKLHTRATLAVIGDAHRPNDLYRNLANRGPDLVDILRDLKQYAHEPLPPNADFQAFVDRSAALARAIR